MYHGNNKQAVLKVAGEYLDHPSVLFMLHMLSIPSVVKGCPAVIEVVSTGSDAKAICHIMISMALVQKTSVNLAS